MGLFALGAGLKVASGIFGSSAAKRRARALRRAIKKETAKLNSLEASRQQITNPYSGVTDVSALYTSCCDCSSKS